MQTLLLMDYSLKWGGCTIWQMQFQISEEFFQSDNRSGCLFPHILTDIDFFFFNSACCCFPWGQVEPQCDMCFGLFHNHKLSSPLVKELRKWQVGKKTLFLQNINRRQMCGESDGRAGSQGSGPRLLFKNIKSYFSPCLNFSEHVSFKGSPSLEEGHRGTISIGIHPVRVVITKARSPGRLISPLGHCQREGAQLLIGVGGGSYQSHPPGVLSALDQLMDTAAHCQ